MQELQRERISVANKDQRPGGPIDEITRSGDWIQGSSEERGEVKWDITLRDQVSLILWLRS
jgi:hypothetical protein